MWRALGAPQALMGLLGLVAFSLALGVVIPQIPPQAANDPQAWLAVQSGLLAQSNGLIRTLGLYDVYHALWFRLLLVLTGLALFVWMVESLELAWQASGRKTWTSQTFSFWASREPQVRASFSLSPEDVLSGLRVLLSECGYRWAEASDVQIPSLVVLRRPWACWAQPLIYGGLLLMLIGLAVVGNWGWQGTDWLPAPGETWVVGHGTPYSIRLDAFGPSVEADGRLCNYRSQITWLEDNSVARPAVVSIGRPATVRGVAVRQVGSVPQVRMQVWDEGGDPLLLQLGGEELDARQRVEVHFSSPDDQPLVLIPSRELFLVLSFESLAPDSEPSLQVALLRNGDTAPQSVNVLRDSGSVILDGLQLELDLTYRPVLRVDARPGMGLVLGGMFLALLALAANWVAPPRLAWIAVGPGSEGQTLVRMLTPMRAPEGRWLSLLADQLREALVDGS
ncbi:MAG: cytochrome c biogenesis protein ResB [Anaerolineae bacterium]|jgi:hypothetical protein